MSSFNRIKLLASLGLAAAFSLSGLAESSTGALAAEDWPTKPIKLVVPWPPGGGVDTYGRAIVDDLSKALGQPVIVENRGGANSATGTAYVAHSEPDGYTILTNNSNGALATPAFSPEILTFDPVKDLKPIGIFAEGSPSLLWVNSELGPKNAEELIALAKSQENALSIGMSGDTSAALLSLKEVEKQLATRFLFVPYKGGGDRINALLAGDIKAILITYPLVRGQVDAGLFRPVLAFSEKRLEQFPDVPTLGDLGIKIADIQSWNLIQVPAQVPDEIVKKLAAGLEAASRGEGLAKVISAGGRAVFQGPEEAAARFEREFAELKRLVELYKSEN